MTETLVEEKFTAEQVDDILEGLQHEINGIAREFQKYKIRGDIVRPADAMDIFLDVGLTIKKFMVQKGER